MNKKSNNYYFNQSKGTLRMAEYLDCDVFLGKSEKQNIFLVAGPLRVYPPPSLEFSGHRNFLFFSIRIAVDGFPNNFWTKRAIFRRHFVSR